MARSLYKSTAVVGSMTLLSRISGMLRDTLMAILFAASAGMDAFLVAFRIPNFLRRVFAEGAFSQAFVPVLTATKATGTPEEVRNLLDVVTGTLAGVLAIVTVVGVLAAPILIFIFAPGFHQNTAQFELAGQLLRLCFPYIFFISLVSLAGGILNAYGRFAVPAFTPVLLNLCIIASAILFAPLLEEPILALGIGVFLAGAAQLAFQWPSLRRLKMLPRPKWGWGDARVRKILRLMLPVIFASSVSQIALLLNTVIASFLPTGSVSWLYYSDRLMEFPLGIFTIAIATVILPSLSSQHARQSTKDFNATLDWAMRLLIIIGSPAMIGLCVLAGPLVVTLFHYRAFTDHDAVMSQLALVAFALGFMGFSIVKVLLPGFYARHDTHTPMRAGVISLTASMGMSVGFVGAAVGFDLPAPHVGLALSVSLGAFVNAALLYRRLRRDAIYQPEQGWARLLFAVLLACTLMAAVLWFAAGPIADWLRAGIGERIPKLAGVIALGASSYFAVLFALGLRPRHLRAPAH